LNLENEILLWLQNFVTELELILTNNIKSTYIVGSIALDDFRINSSDIDVLVISERRLSKEEFSDIKKLHMSLYQTSKWGRRIEVSYIIEEMLNSESIIGMTRSYYNSGQFRYEPYGQEWYIDKHILTSKGICISNEPLGSAIDEVSCDELKSASLKFMEVDLKPLIERCDTLSNEYLVFITLSLCRIIFTLKEASVTSKSGSISWINKLTLNRYSELLDEVINWDFEKNIKRKDECKEFIKAMYKNYENL